ncbi:Retrovirus-related Pol polyprotein from type-1 retrotransposable element R1 4 [Aphis craccivora]|uniref:Retrovirus-related Pol polyprotein from type-1 retrotransposable element R1 4 n=1 Tax=Aphis craccivora TaxID=307492 RepID=A0A6G0YHA3_APHCR|nr:Retrovirus-related Pol polyprotein from type-1 retrotransposable element R1 4 [Aphis craccivora]
MSLTFHMTQTLSGQGCYQVYLKKMNRAKDSACAYCGHPEDNAENTTFDCPRWDVEHESYVRRRVRPSLRPYRHRRLN